MSGTNGQYALAVLHKWWEEREGQGKEGEGENQEAEVKELGKHTH